MTARRLRTVFFGSSQFAVPALHAMLEQYDVVAVCSQPDRPAGRGLKVTATPVAAAARTAGREVWTPQRLDAAFIEHLAAFRPELLACASYGKILPRALLDIAGMTALNVHPSLLPRYRGSTPIQSALREGCTQTGVTVFWMTQRMDAGDIALARPLAIEPTDDYGSLHDRLARLGAELLVQAAALLADGRLTRTPQGEDDATYCKPLTKEDLRLRLDSPARAVVNQIRSLSPKPAAWILFEGRRLKVLQAEVLVDSSERASTGVAPGTLLAIDPAGPVVATSEGAIRLLRVIPEGRAAMSGAEFAKASTARR
jgi:methionyl-tRNA formyltransferase